MNGSAWSPPSAHAARDDLDALKQALVDRIKNLAVELLAEPNRNHSSRRQWRWGTNGSLALEIGGPKRGLFKDFEAADEGGDLFALIMRERRCNFRDAVTFARNWLGWADGQVPAGYSVPLAERDRQKAEREAAEAADREARIGKAQRLWSAAVPASGTVAERYLVQTRRIPTPSAGWPGSVRFHAGERALIVAMTTADGAVQAVQLVRLTRDAKKIAGTQERPTKQVNGPMDGAVIRLPGDPNGPLLIAEGPETGLSVWAATGHETWITARSISKCAPPSARCLVVCRDDDARWSSADHQFERAIQGWRSRDFDVVVATPWPNRRHDKSDFNDAIKAGGPAAVQARIAAALGVHSLADRRVPVDQARHRLDEVSSGFFRAAEAVGLDSGEQPVHAARVDVGVGKSYAVRLHAARFLTRLQARADGRVVVFAVPTHALGVEQATAFEALSEAQQAGLKAAVWRGREAPDPDAPGELMCRNLEAVRDARRVGARVEQAVCRREMPDGTVAVCPFFEACGYQRQKKVKADFWIVPHELIFSPKPQSIGEVAALVVDESVWQAGLEGVEGHSVTLAVDELRANAAIPDDRDATDRLAYLHARFVDAVRDHIGPLERAALLEADLTADMARDARALEWRRKVEPGLNPSMSPSERREAVLAAKGNQTIKRLAKVWGAVEALLQPDGPEHSGWVELTPKDTEDGTVSVLQLRGRRPIGKGWHAPTLLIDATLDMNLVTPYWPSAKLVADDMVETPHQRIYQVTDCAHSKRRLDIHANVPEDERSRRFGCLRDLHATICRIGRQYAPGRVLVVLQKSIKEDIAALGLLPPNIVLAHHNAVAGGDEWKDVAALVVVGRTQPRTAAAERLAKALAGRAVEHLGGRYRREPVGAAGERRDMSCGG